MHCSACSSAVEASLGEMPGVLHSSISLILRKAIVRIDPSLVSHVSGAGAAHRPSLVQRRSVSLQKLCIVPNGVLSVHSPLPYTARPLPGW